MRKAYTFKAYVKYICDTPRVVGRRLRDMRELARKNNCFISPPPKKKKKTVIFSAFYAGTTLQVRSDCLIPGAVSYCVYMVY